MAAWWEDKYGLDSLIDNAWDDEDNDGHYNIEEYLGHSDPTDPNSIPRIMSLPWIPLLLLND